MKIVIATAMILCSLLASATDLKKNIYRQRGVALVDGQCAVVLQKQYQVTAASATTGSYLADNNKLHACQYVQEMAVSPSCSVYKECSTYADWSKVHPEFFPAMPRTAFVVELEKRQSMVSALRAGSPR